MKDLNWLGRNYELSGFYRYNERHSGSLSLRMPHLGASSWGLALRAGKFASIEPAYFGDLITYYNVDRWEFILSVIHHFSHALRLEATAGFLGETQNKNLEKSGENPMGPDDLKYDKWLGKFELIWDAIDYLYIFQQGVKNDLTLEQIHTIGEEGNFQKFLNIFYAYLRAGSAGNFAFRARTGFASNIDSPFVPFVLDSYLTVRGVGNRVAGGTSELTFNFEYRHLVFRKSWAAIQAVAFVDWSAWRPAGGELKELFDSQNIVSFGGLGLRLFLRKFGNLVLRMDFGISLHDSSQHGIVLGIGQYF
jgi:outer membrane protein assembly factor BamA